MKAAVSNPRSYSTIYPWCPPRIGVSLGVLEALESQLRGRLYQALVEKHHSTHSRQSWGSSSIDDFEPARKWAVSEQEQETYPVADIIVSLRRASRQMQADIARSAPHTLIQAWYTSNGCFLSFPHSLRTFFHTLNLKKFLLLLFVHYAINSSLDVNQTYKVVIVGFYMLTTFLYWENLECKEKICQFLSRGAVFGLFSL